MKVTLTFYNHNQTDCYRMIIDDNSIVIKSSTGVCFVDEKELYNVLDTCFGQKIIDGME